MELTLKPSVLRWARERAGLKPEALAEKLSVDASKVGAWERSGRITFSRLEKLAHATRTAIGLLYLPEPPDDRLPVPDFRTVGGEAIGRPSPDLIDVVHMAQARQDWYREYLIVNGAEPLHFVGSFTVGVPPAQAAAEIREVIGLDTAMRSRAATWEEALRLLVEQIEAIGVLVLRSGVAASNNWRPLSVREFRGFVLSDAYAPVVFLNGRDTKSAQMFTLVHETAHIWLGVSGVSNLRQTFAPNSEIEQWCNAVAAELLVPAAELRAKLPAAERRDDPIAALCREFRVSSLVILRRMRDLGILDETTFQERYREEERKFRERDARQAEGGGGDYYATQRVRVSPRFARALIESTFEGKTGYREALHLLGLSKVDTLRKFAADLKMAV